MTVLSAPNAAAAVEPPASAPVSLAQLHIGARGTVHSVSDDDATLGEDTGATIVMRLIEIGFVAG